MWPVFGEMLLAMVAGMAVLGGLDRGIVTAAGGNVDDLRETAPEVVALVMAFNMTAGMAVWMRHLGHLPRAGRDGLGTR